MHLVGLELIVAFLRPLLEEVADTQYLFSAVLVLFLLQLIEADNRIQVSQTKKQAQKR